MKWLLIAHEKDLMKDKTIHNKQTILSDLLVSSPVFVWVKKLISCQGRGWSQLKKQFVVRIKQDKISIRPCNISMHFWRKESLVSWQGHDGPTVVRKKWLQQQMYVTFYWYRLKKKAQKAFYIKCSYVQECLLVQQGDALFLQLYCFQTTYARSDRLGETPGRYSWVKWECWRKVKCNKAWSLKIYTNSVFVSCQWSFKL